MAVGYEARARVTADMSGFVAASRQAAREGKAFADALRDLNAELLTTQRMATRTATAMQGFSQHMQQSNRTQSQGATSAGQLTRAMQQGADAYNAASLAAHLQANAQQKAAAATQQQTQAQQQQNQQTQVSTGNLRAMAREMERLERQQNTLNQVQRENGHLTAQQSQALTTVSNRLTELRDRYGNLTREQRETVDVSRQLAQAQRSVSEAQSSMTRFAREAVTEQRELAKAQENAAQSSRVAESHLRSMGREMEQLTSQRRDLMLLQRQNGQLNRDETRALGTLDERIQSLREEYARLSSAQRSVVLSTQDMVRAQGTISSGMASVSRHAREVAAEQRAMDRAAADLEGGLWGLRSAVGDVSGAMAGMAAAGALATAALWENYSVQEMAIAQISRVSQATALELSQITGAAREMSTEIPLAFAELAEISMLGSQVGVSNAALSQFTETVALFAATSEISADETATLMARIMEMTQMPETEVTNLGSAVAYLGSNSTATDKEILVTTESIATMTTQAGFGAEATIGLASAMASLRIRPELARGAAQRVFLQIQQAATGAGVEMEKLSEITGMSQQAMEEMVNSNFEEFFLRVMEGLSGMKNQAGGLVPILREIGILNTRDADVVARLAGNYDLLAEQLDGAHTAFADGTYLYAESDRIFSTLTAKVQILSNTFSNFMYSAAESLAPLATTLVEAATALVQFLDDADMAPLVGGAAVALAAAGAVGALAASVGFAYQGILGFQGLLSLWRQRALQTSVANGALTASNTSVAASSGTAAASASAAAAANARTATTAGVSAVANTGLAASFRATAVAAAAFAAANPVTAVITLGAAMLGTAAALDVFSDESAKAEAELMSAHEAHITAAGGAVGLKQAIDADTESWREAREEAQLLVGQLDNNTSAWSRQAQSLMENSAYRVSASQEMSEADRIAAEEAEALTRNQRDLAMELGTVTQETDPAAGALQGLAQSEREAAQAGVEADNSIGKVNQSMEAATTAAHDNMYAVGLATRQWAALSLESAALESGILETDAAFQAFRDTGADLGVALTKELVNAGDGADYLRSMAAQAREELSGWDAVAFGLNEFTANMVWPDWRPFTTDAEAAADSLDYMADNLDATTLSMQEATRQTELLGDEIIRLPDGTQATTAQLMEFTGANMEAAVSAEALDMEISSLGISVEDMNEAFTSFMDPLAAWTEAQSEANDKATEANEEFAKLGTDATVNFDTFLTNLEEMSKAQMSWAQNLLDIADEVPPEVLSGLAEMGVDGAAILQGLVDANDKQVDRFVELWSQGSGMATEEFSLMFGDFITQAYESGDTGGAEFVNTLMAKVAEGDISFTEAVDQMTAYAEEQFQNADTTNTPTLENTEAIRELSALIRRIEFDIRNADDTVEPSLDTSSVWSQLSRFATSLGNWVRNNLSFNIDLGIDASDVPLVRPEGYADGGWIGGTGGPREDKVPLWGSRGEFMVNAWSAARYGPELEWINNQQPGGVANRSVPDFVPDNIMSARQTAPAFLMSRTPADVMGAMRSAAHNAGPKTIINITNHYPKAEATSVTTNRTLAYAAALDGLG